MFIEVVIEDIIVDRYEVEDNQLRSIVCHTWEENVAAREKLVNIYIEQVRKLSDQYWKAVKNVHFQLAFMSKINCMEQ